MPAIDVRALSKSFAGRRAVEGLSFAVERGEVFGLLGPNGAGKTTTLRMLAGLYAPDEGSATVAGFEIAAGRAGGPELRARVGLLTESPGFYDRLTARENLTYFAGRLVAVHEIEREDRLRIELAAPFAPDGVRALCKSIRLEGNTLYLEPIAEVPEIVSALVGAGARIAAVVPHRDPLEKAWLEL